VPLCGTAFPALQFERLNVMSVEREKSSGGTQDFLKDISQGAF